MALLSGNRHTEHLDADRPASLDEDALDTFATLAFLGSAGPNQHTPSTALNHRDDAACDDGAAAPWVPPPTLPGLLAVLNCEIWTKQQDCWPTIVILFIGLQGASN